MSRNEAVGNVSTESLAELARATGLHVDEKRLPIILADYAALQRAAATLSDDASHDPALVTPAFDPTWNKQPGSAQR